MMGYIRYTIATIEISREYDNKATWEFPSFIYYQIRQEKSVSLVPLRMWRWACSICTFFLRRLPVDR